MPATVVSLWPTPTVSTRITSKPAASQTSMASRVLSATPPSEPRDGDGRMKASGLTDRCSIRVLSPRMEPPVMVLDGSIASTATRCPRRISSSPRASMNVDFPAPGEPLIPSRIESPVCGRSASSTPAARRRWSDRVDSISVMVFASARGWRFRTPSTSAWSAGSRITLLGRCVASASLGMAALSGRSCGRGRRGRPVTWYTKRRPQARHPARGGMSDPAAPRRRVRPRRGSCGSPPGSAWRRWGSGCRGRRCPRRRRCTGSRSPAPG